MLLTLAGNCLHVSTVPQKLTVSQHRDRSVRDSVWPFCEPQTSDTILDGKGGFGKGIVLISKLPHFPSSLSACIQSIPLKRMHREWPLLRTQGHQDLPIPFFILEWLEKACHTRRFLSVNFSYPKGKAKFNEIRWSALRSEEHIIPIRGISCGLKVVRWPHERVSMSPFSSLCFQTAEKSEPCHFIFYASGDTCKGLGNNNAMPFTLNSDATKPLWISKNKTEASAKNVVF